MIDLVNDPNIIFEKWSEHSNNILVIIVKIVINPTFFRKIIYLTT